MAAAGPMRGVFSSPTFLRLWALGGIVNAMRWVEMLAAGLFTFEVTGSGVAVALVLAARSLPMLCFGAIAGLICDAWDRKRILLWTVAASAASAGAISLLAALGVVRPWQVGVAAFISGIVWATELSGRRRMIGEFAGPALVSRVVALDSLTNSLARILGPLLGSLSYAAFGLAGAYALSAGSYVVGALMVPGIAYSQKTRELRLARLPREMVQGFAYSIRHTTVLIVVAVTAAMNLFAFSYSAIVPPLARIGFGVSDAMVGVIAAGEPTGALIGGLVLARWTPPFNPLFLLIAGSATFMAGLAVMAFMPTYLWACGALVGGGIGLALFGNMQTTLILTRVPAAIRSRQMGLITVVIGVAPVGHLAIGVLAETLGPLNAVVISAATGLLALAVIGAFTSRLSPEREDAGA